jgi:hypothetical protein
MAILTIPTNANDAYANSGPNFYGTTDTLNIGKAAVNLYATWIPFVVPVKCLIKVALLVKY